VHCVSEKVIAMRGKSNLGRRYNKYGHMAASLFMDEDWMRVAQSREWLWKISKAFSVPPDGERYVPKVQ
jgi:hypothetical protein